jgi:hypothetical protein
MTAFGGGREDRRQARRHADVPASTMTVRRVRTDRVGIRVRMAPGWACEPFGPDKVVRRSIPCAAMAFGRLLR